MKKLLIGCLVALVAVPLLLTLVAFFLPASYEVERSIDIQAPREKVHAQLEDLRRWKDWSVWQKRDPDMAVRYSGPEIGGDPRMDWEGESSSGYVTITARDPEKGVWIYMVFGDLQARGALLYSTGEGGEGKTRLTWIQRGDLGNNPVYRYLGLAMESLMGPDVEENLTAIKALAEAP